MTDRPALGLPDEASLDQIFDDRDRQAAALLYQWGLPIVAMARFRQAHRDVLGGADGDVGAYLSFDDRLGILTPNTVTPYYVSFVDLRTTGPVVVECPPGAVAAGASDFWQRHITDMGQTGPDHGAGGRYLLLGPDHEQPADAAAYLAARSRTNNVMLGVRVLATDPDEAKAVVAAFRVYPYARRDDPPRTREVHPDGTRWLQAQPQGLDYFRSLAEILGEEPVDARDEFFAGIARTLGIERGKPFDPDERQARLLAEGATAGERMAQATAFAKRFPTALYRPDCGWEIVPNLEPSQTLDDVGQFFERAAWFYEATGMSEGMAHPVVGAGQAYLGAYRDAGGQWLDGGRAYRLRVPAGAPAQQFWSVCIYDTLTRTLVDNPTRVCELSSRQDLVTNDDGSVEISFGPERPAGADANWLQTLPGRPWFAYLRLYAPTEPYFDRTWPLGPVERA